MSQRNIENDKNVPQFWWAQQPKTYNLNWYLEPSLVDGQTIDRDEPRKKEKHQWKMYNKEAKDNLS